MVLDKEMETVAALQTWVQSHPTLPHNIDPQLLRRYLQANRYDVAKTHRQMELGFAMRNKHPKIFIDRDPADEAMQCLIEMTVLLPLPIVTHDNCKVLIFRMAADADASDKQFNFNDAIKLFFMVADVRLICGDHTDGTFTDGEIPIFDMAGLSLKHITRVVLSTLRVYMKYTQECHPIRLRHVHVINCSPFLDRLLVLVKPFFNSDIFKLLHFHSPNSKTLEAFIAPEVLPIEYGGSAGRLKDLKRMFVAKLMQHRDYLMDESRWRSRSDEKKKTVVPSLQEPTQESFSKLCFD